MSAAGTFAGKPRSFKEECSFISRIDATRYKINIGFVPGMRVHGEFYVNKQLEGIMFEELQQSCNSKGIGGFLPAVKQIANVASLPGIVSKSIGLPDVHSGYGFAIGNVAAFDMDDPEAIVSPGGVGFDINWSVCLSLTHTFTPPFCSYLLYSSSALLLCFSICDNVVELD